MPWNDKRPMSPHLQIYKLPFTAKLSIFHRATGIALFIGILFMVAVLVTAALGKNSWALMHFLLSSWFGYLILFGFTFSLYYHLANGIRHLFWDMGKGLALKQANISGVIVLIMSFLLTLLTWILA